MADDEFFGDRTRQAEIDLCAANYIRHRIEMASVAVNAILEGLEARAQEFWNRGEEHVRALSPPGTPDEVIQSQSDMLLTFLAAHLGKSEPGADRVALCNRMVMDAGGGNELQTILWLIGEDLTLPPDEPRPHSAPQADRTASASGRSTPAKSPAPRAAEPRQAARTVTPAPPAPATALVALDEFLGVIVPAHEHAKGRLIMQDALYRAENEGNLSASPYVNGRGLNSWQPKLLKAAFGVAMADIASRPNAASRAPAADLPPHQPSGQQAAADDLEVDEEDVHPETHASEHVASHLSAEPVEEEFFGENEADASESGDAASTDLFSEPTEDPDDAPVLTTPLAPPARPQPVLVTTAPPASRPSPPPVRPASREGLMSSNVGAPARTRPSFLPPVRTQT